MSGLALQSNNYNCLVLIPQGQGNLYIIQVKHYICTWCPHMGMLFWDICNVAWLLMWNPWLTIYIQDIYTYINWGGCIYIQMYVWKFTCNILLLIANKTSTALLSKTFLLTALRLQIIYIIYIPLSLMCKRGHSATIPCHFPLLLYTLFQPVMITILYTYEGANT